MRITVGQLRRLIKEELERMEEASPPRKGGGALPFEQAKVTPALRDFVDSLNKAKEALAPKPSSDVSDYFRSLNVAKKQLGQGGAKAALLKLMQAIGHDDAKAEEGVQKLLAHVKKIEGGVNWLANNPDELAKERMKKLEDYIAMVVRSLDRMDAVTKDPWKHAQG